MNTARNPTAMVINRPFREPLHLRRKGPMMIMEDGSICGSYRDDDNKQVWVLLTPTEIRDFAKTLDCPPNK